MRAAPSRSPVRKRSINCNGHKTSVSLEDEFWSGLKEISAQKSTTVFELVSEIDKTRDQGNLSSTLRLFVLAFYRDRMTIG